MQPRLMVAFAALALAACNAEGPAPQAAPPEATSDATPGNFVMPGGEGCAGDVARYRAVTDADATSGNLAKSVHKQIEKEIGAADEQCSAGHEAQARASVLASRKRHGYPGDL